MAIAALVGFFIVESLTEASAKPKNSPGKEGQKRPLSGIDDDPEYVIRKIAGEYGPEIAANVERIYRHETDNFTSQQYLIGRSAGQEAVSKRFPYGWNADRKFWESNPELAPIALDYWERDSGGRQATFLVYENLYAGAKALAEFLKRHGNYAGRWFSNDKGLQASYNRNVQKVTPKYV